MSECHPPLVAVHLLYNSGASCVSSPLCVCVCVSAYIPVFCHCLLWRSMSEAVCSLGFGRSKQRLFVVGSSRSCSERAFGTPYVGAPGAECGGPRSTLEDARNPGRVNTRYRYRCQRERHAAIGARQYFHHMLMLFRRLITGRRRVMFIFPGYIREKTREIRAIPSAAIECGIVPWP